MYLSSRLFNNKFFLQQLNKIAVIHVDIVSQMTIYNP